MEFKSIKIDKPEEINLILGQAHFIKTVDDLHEALATAVPGIQFGLAFCEASGPCLIRTSGTDPPDRSGNEECLYPFRGTCFPHPAARGVSDQCLKCGQVGSRGLHDLLRQFKPGGGDRGRNRARERGDGGDRRISTERGRDRRRSAVPQRITPPCRIQGVRHPHCCCR